MDVGLIEALFAYTRKNAFADFADYHNLYKSLIELKQYYLTYEHVEALPTFEDKEIYFYMILIYHFDKFFSEQRFVKELLQMDEITNTEKDKQLKMPKKEKEGYSYHSKPLQEQLQRMCAISSNGWRMKRK